MHFSLNSAQAVYTMHKLLHYTPFSWQLGQILKRYTNDTTAARPVFPKVLKCMIYNFHEC